MMVLDVDLLCFRETIITESVSGLDIVGERTKYESYVMVHIDH